MSLPDLGTTLLAIDATVLSQTLLLLIILVPLLLLMVGLPIMIQRKKNKALQQICQSYGLEKINKNNEKFIGEIKGYPVILESKMGSRVSEYGRFHYYSLTMEHKAATRGRIASIFTRNTPKVAKITSGGAFVKLGETSFDKLFHINALTDLSEDGIRKILDRSVQQCLKEMNGTGIMTASHFSVLIAAPEIELQREIHNFNHFESMADAAVRICESLERNFPG
ncbi:MAG: hypothetical protein CVV64_04645 [Candidatus Wallbacteria bacterium HGW-Wallbacteria-1]|jgi:hypothetical protein|uniref:Uncharacterized protein n=1 Tax=Candidatus Wallbacteria bacterium HGW-Wallbacteria-1 TaxID=2013854 RepID=A0A2N1PRU3_9BACT|nr:MAG: hypothetical protein CVV64_04645 [Candidatus Wallbacteria bacterium HGW-Wallbacteria-1]